MKQVLFLLCLTLIDQNSNAQTLPEPTGRSLRVIVADKYSDGSVLIGGTTGSWAFDTNTGLIMDREFNYVTPENDFKQRNIHPDNSEWNWEGADAWINHIAAQDQVLRIHGPIGPQCSQWAQDDGRTASELAKNMNDFMQAICERYNGTPGIEYMDVVNETVINGGWHMGKPGHGWENPWFKIGQDSDTNNTPLYIKKAFLLANEYAPDIKLIFNHHEHPEKLDSWILIKETVTYLRKQGLRVDGIGWQAHVDVGWESSNNLQELRDLIDWAHSNELEFHVTEASVWLREGKTGTSLEQQARTYRAIVEVLLEKRSSGRVGWNTWHIDDGHGWHTERFPSIFDENYVAKPAYYSIQELLEGNR
ncbi:MAG: endo-1,4-beta-xylanase [Saprospiraceae bacterium]|nr:endo-1,4-beta-xylanase [Saprospiraceae bacterium]